MHAQMHDMLFPDFGMTHACMLRLSLSDYGRDIVQDMRACTTCTNVLGTHNESAWNSQFYYVSEEVTIHYHNSSIDYPACG